MSTAAERLAAIDELPPTRLIAEAEFTLDALVRAMHEETALFRTGRFRDAITHTAEKTRLAQDYVGLVRSIQRQTTRLLKEAPEDVKRLRSGHEKLVTQMAENLRVIATARMVTEDVLTDAAKTVGQKERTTTYGNTGIVDTSGTPARGIAVNRAL